MRRLLSLLRTVPLYKAVVATYYGALSTEPRPTFAPRLRHRTGTRPRFGRIGLPGRPAQTALTPVSGRTRRVALLAPSHLRRRRSPIRTFGTEDQRHSVELFLHNKTHITRAASAFSLNHRCELPPQIRSRAWAEPNNLAGRGKTLPKTIFPNILLSP
jgi:hypothetical protein